VKTNLTIRNCPATFRFECSERWGELAPTDDPTVRHCGRCGSDVFLCADDEATIAHANLGHCIAREVPDHVELPRVVVGRPAEPIVSTHQQEEAGRWSARERGIDDAIRNAARSSRSCPRCSYPASDWRKTCRVCGHQMGRSVVGPGI